MVPAPTIHDERHRWAIAPQYIEQFRIVPSTFKASAPIIQPDCPSMPRTWARTWDARRSAHVLRAELLFHASSCHLRVPDQADCWARKSPGCLLLVRLWGAPVVPVLHCTVQWLPGDHTVDPEQRPRPTAPRAALLHCKASLKHPQSVNTCVLVVLKVCLANSGALVQFCCIQAS